MVQKPKARRGQAETARPKRPSPAELPCPGMHADGAIREEPKCEEEAKEWKDIAPAAADDAADDENDDPDDDQFDPHAVDFLGDFGLDDDEAIPDRNDFWFDDVDASFD